MLIKQGFKQVSLLGIDGFSPDLDNYTYTQTDQVLDANKIEELNASIKSALTSLTSQITLNFLAESPLKPATKPKVVGVIPARYASTRLPGKPLADICGLPMVIHTMKRAMLCQELDQILVATDDQRIFDLVEQHGGKAVMTSPTLDDGINRAYEITKNSENDIIVIINGDEPLLKPSDISKSANELIENKNSDASMLVVPYSERNNISNIKVVTDNNDYVLYTSRSDIPSDARCEKQSMLKGYYLVSMRKQVLEDYTLKLNNSTLNYRESLNENKLLENGYKLKAIKTDSEALSVDTPEDLEIVRELMKSDELFTHYK